MSIELMQTIAPYITGPVIVGALLLVVGLLVRLMGNTESMKGAGNTTMGYGVVVILFALALWAIGKVIKGWRSGVIEAWLGSW